MRLRMGIRLAVAVGIVLGLFMLGVGLTPSAPVAYAVSYPPAPAQFSAGPGANGTLASFTALIPESMTAFLPSIVK